MDLRVKICGLTDEESVAAAASGGAAYVGFVFFPRSPRAVSPMAARALCDATPPGVCKVGLFVDPSDEMLEETLSVVPLDMIQLHGDEGPRRIAEIRERVKLPVMKAVKIASKADVMALDAYEDAADQLLCDAKPRAEGELPGGNGVAFDWRLIADRTWRRPWMLAGGLTADNVAHAAALTGAAQVDVSSGVERAPGRKDPERIRAFLAAAGAAPAPVGSA